MNNEYSVKKVKEMLDNKKAVLIDVREKIEHDSEHIEGSVHLPLSNFTSEQLAPFKDKEIIIHCAKGMRSQKACEMVQSLPVSSLSGGIEGWKTEGFPTQSTGRKIIPLERQIQLAIGVFLLLINIVGFSININFLYLTSFIGLGLMMAGLTGFCGLAFIIAKMPWNK